MVIKWKSICGDFNVKRKYIYTYVKLGEDKAPFKINQDWQEEERTEWIKENAQM